MINALLGLLIIGLLVYCFMQWRERQRDAVARRREREEDYFNYIKMITEAEAKNPSAGEPPPQAPPRAPADFHNEPETRRTVARANDRMLWATNAPPRWPQFYSKPISRMPAGHRINDRFFLALITQTLTEAGYREGENIILGGACLTEQGILDVPVQLRDEEGTTPIFFYSSSDSRSAAHFAQVSRLLQENGTQAPVYLAPQPLAQAQPAQSNICRPFSPEDLKLWKGDTPREKYAMWWNRSQDRPLEAGLAAISEAYELLDGIESYVAALFMHQFGLAESDQSRRLMLPQEKCQLTVEGPEGLPFLLTMSAAKGLRFHFDVTHTSPRYRDCFWRHFADFVRSCRQEIKRTQLPLDPPREESPLHWWQRMQDAARGRTGEINIGAIDLTKAA